MSQVYATEPQTTGRVILETSHGPIDINLWCKECPTTTRMFLQLCLDGYYDSVVFHRIMENFLIQAGQVKFSGDGRRKGGDTQDIATEGDMKRYLLEHATAAGESSGAAADVNQSSRRKLEVSPRIRFNHRGQVALALPLDEDVEGNASADALKSQFFITLDESSFLDGKHVIFGTVVGPTIFNALRIGKVAVEDDTSRPIDMDMSPPIVKNVKIDHQPFQDLVPTVDSKVPWKQNRGRGRGGGDKSGAGAGGESEVKKRRKIRKGKRDLNVLSFGEEMADDVDGGGGDGDDGGGIAGMRSSHDVLASESKFLSSSIDHGVKEAAVDDGEKLRKKRRKYEDEDAGGNTNFDESRATCNLVANMVENGEKSSREKKRQRVAIGDEQTKRRDHKKLEKKDASAAKEKSEKYVSAVEARRAKYLKGGASRRAGNASKSKREEDTLSKLFSFRSKMLQSKGKSDSNDRGGKTGDGAVDNSLAARMAKRSHAEEHEAEDVNVALAPMYHGQVLEDADDEDVSSPAAWLKTQFKCRKHIDHGTKKGTMDEEQNGGDGRNMDDYEVLDSKRRGNNDVNNDRRPGQHRGHHIHDRRRHCGGGGGHHHSHKHHRRHGKHGQG